MLVQLFLHTSGFGWDEAAVALGGLVALTGLVLLSLRRGEPLEPMADAAPAQRLDTSAAVSKRRRR